MSLAETLFNDPQEVSSHVGLNLASLEPNLNHGFNSRISERTPPWKIKLDKDR